MTTPNQQLPEPPDFASPIAAEERDGQRALDALGPGWIAVLSGSTATPPAAAPQGARYIVPTGATGDWSGHARHVAYMTPEGWNFRAPRTGWVALVLDEGDLGRTYVYSGTDWERMTGDAFLLATLDATDVTFDGYGLPGDPADVDAALEELFTIAADHEFRIDTLEASSGGGGSGGNVTPDTHPTSPNVMDDEFEDGTLNARWSWRNQGGATVNFMGGAAIIKAPNNFAIAHRMLEQAVPSGTWRMRCKVKQWIAASNFTRAGLFVHRSASGKSLAVDIAYSGGFKHEANSWNINGPYIGGISSGGVGSIAALGDPYQEVYLEVEYDGSSVYTFRCSKSGHDGTFFTIGTEAQATNLGGAADTVGIYVNCENNAGDSYGAFDWFRRMA